MKKIMIRVLLVLLALIVGYLVFNQIDARPYRSKLGTLPVLTPDVFEKNNGFYRLWTLIAPKDADIESDAALLPYRRLFDPAFDNDRYIKEFNRTWADYKKNYKNPKELQPVFDVMKYGVDWLSALKQYQGQLTKASEKYDFMLARYEKLINCESFSDFSLVRADTPIPNLLAWLHTAKLSIALDIMAAQNGNSLEAATHLLRHLHFAGKVIPNSRTLITNLIAKAVARMSIWALNNIMNQKDCPSVVFDLVYENTKSISADEFGSKIPFMCEAQIPMEHGSGFFERILYWFLFQKNRTDNYRLGIMERYSAMEQTPPYQWGSEPLDLKPFASGPFWWLQNPIGKHALDMFAPNLFAVVYKSYALKTAYDMLHIVADLHRSFDPKRSLQSQLNDLPSYRELLDPCSGKPYIWNESKQLLYSIGIDRRDNQGDTKDYQAWQDSDYALPVITFVK
jgi:hypothetical protein